MAGGDAGVRDRLRAFIARHVFHPLGGMALDPQFAAPTFFQVLNPHTFLTTERWAAPVADRIVVRRRYQDEMALSVGVPAEDEVALGTITGLSPYLGWYFPRGLALYDRY